MSVRAHAAGSRRIAPPATGALPWHAPRNGPVQLVEEQRYPPPQRYFSGLHRAFAFSGKGRRVHRQALIDPEQDHDSIPRRPDGRPVAFNLEGEPIPLREAIELADDLDRCTLVWTPLTLPSGRPAVLRTIFRVFDDEAPDGPVPAGHEPQLYASVLYTADPEPRFLKRLWTYASAAEANAAHPEAVEEFRSGRAHVEY